MRLPGNRLVAAGNRKRAEPEQQVDAEPGREEKQHAGIAQHTAQRNRRNAVGAFIGTRATIRAALRAEKQNAWPLPSLRRSPPTRRSSEIVRRHAWPDATPLPPPQSPQETTRKRIAPKRRATALPKGSSHTALTPKMCPVGVNESVGDKRPDIRAAAGQRAAEHERIVVARRDESEVEQKFDVLLLAQQRMCGRRERAPARPAQRRRQEEC